MKPKKKVEEAIRRKLRFTAGSTFRDRLLTEVMDIHEEFKGTGPALHEPGIRRTFMRSPVAKLTSIAAVIAVAALSIALLSRFNQQAYALGQTVEALQKVRFLHLIEHDDSGNLWGERWIEIGEDGYQVRYRQQNPPSVTAKHAGVSSMVIEDGTSTAVYRSDKNAVILYDRKDCQYQWVSALGKAFENLLNEGQILQEDADYQGRRAHRVWWPNINAECYVDPETKLPMAIGNAQLSYEVLPAGIFDIVTPEGYTVIDRRPGAAGQIPSWLLEEETAEEQRETKREYFDKGALALARRDYAEAVRQFEQALEWDSWATFWLGSAYYELGQYNQAAEYFAKMLQNSGGDAKPVPFCNYALGLAQAWAGRLDAATANFQACLPAMIQTLRDPARTPSGGRMFESADSPTVRYGLYRPSEQEIVVKMVNRLRVITGQRFAYDPNGTAAQKEAAVAAWEQWFKSDGKIRFTPDAELLPVPASADPKQADAKNSPAAIWTKCTGYGHKTNQEIASQYNSSRLELIQDSATLLKDGMALYDVGRYEEALTLFERMEKKAGQDQLERAVALLWQGHMLDLLGARDPAILAYRKVADMGISRQIRIRHEQFGYGYSPSVYAAERMTTPFVRVDNLWQD